MLKKVYWVLNKYMPSANASPSILKTKGKLTQYRDFMDALLAKPANQCSKQDLTKINKYFFLSSSFGNKMEKLFYHLAEEGIDVHPHLSISVFMDNNFHFGLFESSFESVNIILKPNGDLDD